MPRFSFRMCKIPFPPIFHEKGKEVGWVLRLNKGTEESWVGRGRNGDKPSQGRIAEQGLHIHFVCWKLEKSVWELLLLLVNLIHNVTQDKA